MQARFRNMSAVVVISRMITVRSITVGTSKNSVYAPCCSTGIYISTWTPRAQASMARALWPKVSSHGTKSDPNGSQTNGPGPKRALGQNGPGLDPNQTAPKCGLGPHRSRAETDLGAKLGQSSIGTGVLWPKRGGPNGWGWAQLLRKVDEAVNKQHTQQAIQALA